MWPEVDVVLGPGRWRPGRLGDENTRMPGPGPEVVGSSRVAFVRESLPRRASLDRIQGERGPVVVGPVRVGVRCWCRGGPGPWLAVRWAASPFRVNQAARAVVVLPAGHVDRAGPSDEASPEPGVRAVGWPWAGPAGSLPGRGARGRCGSSRAIGESWLPAPGPGTEVSRPRS
jgi:hypothetical protein